MEIEEKYLKLLNTYIYDKRIGLNGMLSGISITRLIGGYMLSYDAYMSRQYSNRMIFIEDFEKGNVVFLLPFGVNYMVKEMEEMAERHTEAIKEFFGDKFREDMIMRISEEERQEQIREMEKLTLGIENWDKIKEMLKD